MALSPGTVSIDATTGAVSGSGYARELYDLEADTVPFLGGDLDTYVDAQADASAAAAIHPESWQEGGASRAGVRATFLAARQSIAAKCNALAAAHVAFVQSATVTVPVPSTPTTAIGVVT